MTDYLQKMKSTANNLVTVAQPITDEDCMLHILGGLGPDYDALVVCVTSRPVTITLADLHGLLLIHASRLEHSTIVEQGFEEANFSGINSNAN